MLGDGLDDELLGRDSPPCRLVSDALGDLGRQVDVELGHHTRLPIARLLLAPLDPGRPGGAVRLGTRIGEGTA